MSPALTHALADERFRALASRIAYPGLVVEVLHEQVMPAGAKGPTHVGHYLRIFCPHHDPAGAPRPWRGRKWHLHHATSEMAFVDTAFRAVLEAYETIIRTMFKVDGVAVMARPADLFDAIEFMRSGGKGKSPAQ